MIPTGRLVALAFVPVVVALGYVFTDAALVAAATLDVLLLAVGGVDAWLNDGRLTARRAHAAVWSAGEPTEVRVQLHNVGGRALAVRVTDEAPGEAHGLPAPVDLAPGDRRELTYTATIHERGRHGFGAIPVRWRSPLGLWEHQVRLLPPADDPASVKVYPDFRVLRRYGLAARQDDQRMPVRARRRPGGENEFERLRTYVPGDPYRHIDWKASARKQRFIVREFGQEVNQNVIFLLDAGRMMGARVGDRVAFDHALHAALSMGHVALRHGDRVGLLVFDSAIRRWLPPKGGARTSNRLVQGVYDVFPSSDEPDYAQAFRHLAAHVRRRSLVVLLTTVVDDVAAAQADAVVRAMAGRHLPVVVWLRDPALYALAEGRPADDAGFFAAAAAAELVAWRERSLQGLRQRGALVVDVPPDALSAELLGQYLEIKARRML